MKPAPAAPRARQIDWEAMHRRLLACREALQESGEEALEREQSLLRERAASLAQAVTPAQRAQPPQDCIEVLVFQVAGERYAFETAHVAQVSPMLPVTPLPNVPDHVVGIVAVQGRVMSVLDMRSLLDLPLSRLAEPEAIIVLEGPQMEFGILAEAIAGIERYAPNALQSDLTTLGQGETSYLKGVTPDRTAILDAARLLADERLLVEAD